jgi:hypothetical protein
MAEDQQRVIMGQCFLLHVNSFLQNQAYCLLVMAKPYESMSVESPNTSLHVASDGSALFLLILEVPGSYLGQEDR